MDGSLINVGGTLYGATYNGGANDAGTVFALAPPAIAGRSWTKSLVYSFIGGSVAPSARWCDLGSEQSLWHDVESGRLQRGHCV